MSEVVMIDLPLLESKLMVLTYQKIIWNVWFEYQIQQNKLRSRGLILFDITGSGQFWRYKSELHE